MAYPTLKRCEAAAMWLLVRPWWRYETLIARKRRLAKLLARNSDKLPCAIVYNEHLEHDGALVFDHACRMGLEGIVSKRLDAPYRSGPSKVWLKSKNPLSEAVRREPEEDWDDES
jgi:bifunctional non-homologous end joining protein LigD